MTGFRRPIFYRLVLTWVFFATLAVQAQTVFACALMGGTAQSVCCCEDEGTSPCNTGGGCVNHEALRSGDCCVAELQVTPLLESNSPVAAQVAVLLLNAPQAPPPAYLALATLAWPNQSLRKVDFSSFIFSSGTHTFLHTQRLRI